ncbi:hypothetical protein I552_6035 [Mycobacterium xenopi 3993]|nr:hypothetical protein I552_6035 [Mycobacterium xenopi 3993]
MGSARLCRAVIMHGCGTARHLFSAEVCLAVYVLSMMPISGLAVVLAVFSRRRQQHMVAAKLPGMVAAGLVTPNETTWLGSMRAASSRSAGSAVRRPAARKAVKNLAAQMGGATYRTTIRASPRTSAALFWSPIRAASVTRANSGGRADENFSPEAHSRRQLAPATRRHRARPRTRRP